ncbi:MAG TPA: penicillin-binding protein activator, partial [Longimicrobiales bacterium]|nr:penicillin-binding protein activator [Longimicrobiales bacterium]
MTPSSQTPFGPCRSPVRSVACSPVRGGVRTAALALALGLFVAGCATVADTEPEPEGPPPVVLRPGPTSDEEEDRADRLYQAALADYQRGVLAGAVRGARTVVDELPSTRRSGDALRLLAAALERSGETGQALEAAARYASLLPPEDPRLGAVRLVEGRALIAEGRPAEAATRLVGLPPATPDDVRDDALALLRELSSTLDRDALGDVLAGTPLGQPLAAPLMVAYARALRLSGRNEEAGEYARAALDAGATGPDEEVARSLLADLGVEGAAGTEATGPPVQIAAVLSTSGSPTLQQYASRIEEGVRAALASDQAPGNVELVVRDDAGDPTQAAELIRSLEAGPVVGVVGPLVDDVLSGAAAARSGPLPIISPTALTARGDAGIFSLGAPDPGSARALARYAAETGLEYVVVIHPDDPDAAFQADAFRETFQELRGSVLRTLTYPPGTTYFEEALRQAEALEPDALFLPAPADDIEALAPQVSFFGLDTLGVKVLGTADWASEEVLQSVSPRHTNGVVTATPRRPGPASEAYDRFVQAYESTFQRSVRDPLPAAGYDAASLILLAIRTGARTPADVRRALERI